MTTPQTSKLKLNKPPYTKVSDIFDLNDNFQKIDDALGGLPSKVNQLENRTVLTEGKLSDIESKATAAVQKADSVQTQFNQVVIEGDSSVEAAQARVNAEGTAYPTLKNRLDETDNKLGIWSETVNEHTAQLHSIESANSNEILPIVNYLGNLQNIHPKVLYFKNRWNGYRYWMAYTPYPNGDTTAENPCIAVSDDMINWTVPTGLTNPLDPTPAEGYNSDTHLVYREDTGVLELWWRQYQTSSSRIIYRRTSTDGVNWTEKEVVLSLGSSNDMLSPAIIYEDGKYKVWYCRAGSLRVSYRETIGSNISNWTNEQQVLINWWTPNLNPWHIDVIKTDLGYEMVVQAYDRNTGSNNSADLYYVLQKNDGTITYPKLILARSGNPEAIDYGTIYRSSLLKKDGIYYLFYTATDINNRRSISLSVGKNILGLNGYVKQKGKVLEVWNQPTLNNFDVSNADILRFSGATETVINSLKAGYKGQRITLILGASNIKVTLKNGSSIALPYGKDYILDDSQRVMDLVFDGAWKSVVSPPKGITVEMWNKDNLTNYDVTNVSMIRFTGTVQTIINSFAGGYHGQRLTLVLGSSSVRVKLVHGSNLAMPNGTDYILDDTQRVMDLINDNGVWKASVYKPKSPRYATITTDLTNYDVSNLDTLIITNSVTINSFASAEIGKVLNLVVSGSSTVATIKAGSTLVPPGNTDYSLNLSKLGMVCICTASGVWRCF